MRRKTDKESPKSPLIGEDTATTLNIKENSSPSD